MKTLKKLVSGLILGALMLASPIIMDHAKDIYLEEVVTPKAMPVKIFNRTIASSFQLEWKGKRVTVTNNHVCSVVEEVARRRENGAYAKAMEEFERVLAIFGKLYSADQINQIKKLIRQKYGVDKKYPIVGESLMIGDINRKILYNSSNHDICFLEPVGDRAFSLASSVHRGEKITIIGHPRGMPQSITDGRIVGAGKLRFPWIKEAGKVRYLRSTATSYPGNSGSPVVNRYGNVVGILFAGRNLNYLNVNCVVPLEYVRNELMIYFNQRK